MSENPDLPSLREIAREMFWSPDCKPDDAEIEDALRRASLSPTDEMERKRLLSFLKADYEQRIHDRQGEIGECTDEVLDDLGDEAESYCSEDILYLAEMLKDTGEGIEEANEDDEYEGEHSSGQYPF